MILSWSATVSWLGHVLLGGGLLLLFACLLLRWVRQPALRQWLGDWGLTAALVLAVASMMGPTWLVLNWSLQGPAAEKKLAQIVPHPWPVLQPGDGLFSLPEDRGIESGEWIEEGAGPGEVLPIEEGRGEVLPSFDLALVGRWFGLGYLGVGALFMLRWLAGHVALLRLLKRTGPPSVEVAKLFRALAKGPQRPRLLVSPHVQVPLSCGLWRPTIVLPEKMNDNPEPQRLRWVFIHELTHLERRDAWSGLFFGLGQGLFWGLPWFWWLWRQVRLCQEYIADAAARGSEEPAADYAEFLLSLTGAPAVSLAASGVSGNGSDLFRRISMLLQNPLRIEKNCPRRWSWTAAVALVALALVGAGVGVRAEAADTVIIIIGGQDKDVKVPTTIEKAKVIRLGEGPKDNVFWLEGGEGSKAVRVPVEAKPGQVFERKIETQQVLRIKQADGTEKVIVLPPNSKLLLDNLIQPPPPVPPAQIPSPPLVAPVAAPPVTPAVVDQLNKLLDSLKKNPEVDTQDLRKALERYKSGYALPPDVLFPKPIVIDPRYGLPREPKLEAYPVQPPATPRPPTPPPVPVTPGATHRAPAPLQEPAQRIQPTPAATAKPMQPGAEIVIRKTANSVQVETLKKTLLDLQKQLAKLGQEDAVREIGKALRQLEAENAGRAVYGYRVTTPSPAQLGLKVEAPSAILADQLNLPKNSGLVITKVEPGSVAEKAGLRVNDVLLEINGMPIPSDGWEKVAAHLAAVRTRTPDAKGPQAGKVTYLRKGKPGQATLILPETEAGAKQEESIELYEKAYKGQLDKASRLLLQPPAIAGQVTTTTSRSGDRFTAKHVEGGLTITVTGSVAGGRAKIDSIQVQEGTIQASFDTVDAVPTAYRDRVRYLVDISVKAPAGGQPQGR